MTQVERNMRRAWELIMMHLDALMFSAHGGRAYVICNDGFRLQIGFNMDDVKERREIMTLNVFAQADALRGRWSYARNPARGKHFGVKVEDVVELIWEHGGVDLARSRDAAAALKRKGTDGKD